MNTQSPRAVAAADQMLVVSHPHGSLYQHRRREVQPIVRIAGGILLPPQCHHLSRTQIGNGPPSGRVLVVDAGRALAGQGHRRLDRSRWWRWSAPPRLGRWGARVRRPSGLSHLLLVRISLTNTTAGSNGSSSSIEPSIATALTSSWSPIFIDPVQQNAGRSPLAGRAVHVRQHLESGARCSHSHMRPARTSRRTAAAPAGGLQAGLRLHQTSDEGGAALDISISISLLVVRHVEENRSSTIRVQKIRNAKR